MSQNQRPSRLLILPWLVSGSCLFAQGTAFVYQGQLANGNAPANGVFDVTFALFATNAGGVSISVPVTNSAVGVTNGFFTAIVDFGEGAFNGGSCWLELGVRTNYAPDFTILTPRQPILPAPYAIYAANSGNAATANSAASIAASNILGTVQLSQLPSVVVTNNESGVTLNGLFVGNGGGLTNFYASGLVNDTTILSIDASTNPPTPSTNWAFYMYDPNSTNFLTRGGIINPNPLGAYGEYYEPAYMQTGADGATNFEQLACVTTTFGMTGNTVVVRLSGNDEWWSPWVNGVDNFVTNHVPNDGNEHWYQINFATASSKTITLSGAWPFLGVYIPITNGYITDSGQTLPVLAILGDSFTEQAYAPAALCEGIASQLQLTYPQWSVWAFGQGGTGYVNPGISGGTNFAARAQDVIKSHPSCVVIYGGINDTGFISNNALTNTLYLNATNLFFQLRAALTNNQPIVVLGPQWPRYAYPTGDANVYDTAYLLSNACATVGLHYFSPIASPPWITGQVNIPNSGNADVYTRLEDGTHPTLPLGTRYYAAQIAACLACISNGPVRH